MIKEIRWKKILDLLQKNEIVLVIVIIDTLGISPTTLRRDLIEMENAGFIIRLHGGVKLPEQKRVSLEQKLNQKIIKNSDAKNLMAKRTIKLIKEQMCIYLDSGSSTLAMIKFIPLNLEIRILTNSILHAELLAIRGFSDIYLLGGKYKSSTGALIGWEALNTLQKYSIDLAFLGVNGILNGILYTTDPEEGMIKAQVIKQAVKTYILADATKFGQKSFVEFATIQEAEIITNR